MELYCIRNKEGKFFKPTGYGGSGNHWNDTLEKAKFYPKIGPAKAQVTFWANKYPEFGVPQLLKFSLNASQAEVIEMEGYVEKNIKKKEEAKQKYKKAELQRKHNELAEKIKSLEENT